MRNKAHDFVSAVILLVSFSVFVCSVSSWLPTTIIVHGIGPNGAHGLRWMAGGKRITEYD